MSEGYYYDPYERKRRAARVMRQNKLAKIASAGLPIDGDPVETRKPVRTADSLLDAAIESVTRDMYSEETRFFDMLRERWDGLFPNCPARPGRWQDGKLVLYVATAGQSFAMRPKLPAMKKKIRELEGVPQGRFALLVEIRAASPTVRCC